MPQIAVKNRKITVEAILASDVFGGEGPEDDNVPAWLAAAMESGGVVYDSNLFHNIAFYIVQNAAMDVHTPIFLDWYLVNVTGEDGASEVIGLSPFAFEQLFVEARLEA